MAATSTPSWQQDEHGDTIMTDAKSASAEAPVNGGETAAAHGAEAVEHADVTDPIEASKEPSTDAPVETAEDPPEPPEVKVSRAESQKADGNAALKAGDLGAALEHYTKGSEAVRGLVGNGSTSDTPAETLAAAKAVYLSLQLNAAMACLKLEMWEDGAHYATLALEQDPDNVKAMFRRGVCRAQLPRFLDEARDDLTAALKAEPNNRDAREQLAKVKQQLKEFKQQEKERMAAMFSKEGALYNDQHQKLSKLRALYEQEVERRKEASEEEITFEDWRKKEDEAEKKRKEKLEEEQKEARKKLEEERRAAQKEEEQGQQKPHEIARMEEDELDEEDRKILGEAKKKGYYHGRLHSVRSDAAPVPQKVDGEAQSGSTANSSASAWNAAGTWEERDASKEAEDKLRQALAGASMGNKESRSSPEAMLDVLKDGNALKENANDASSLARLAGMMFGVELTLKVKHCSGEASLAVVRNAQRFIFDFKADLEWKMRVDENLPGEEDASKVSEHKGKVKLAEITDAAVKGRSVEMIVTWSSAKPTGVSLQVCEEWLRRLRAKIVEQLDVFVSQFV